MATAINLIARGDDETVEMGGSALVPAGTPVIASGTGSNGLGLVLPATAGAATVVGVTARQALGSAATNGGIGAVDGLAVNSAVGSEGYSDLDTSLPPSTVTVYRRGVVLLGNASGATLAYGAKVVVAVGTVNGVANTVGVGAGNTSGEIIGFVNEPGGIAAGAVGRILLNI